jgi:hypothetical protein
VSSLVSQLCSTVARGDPPALLMCERAPVQINREELARCLLSRVTPPLDEGQGTVGEWQGHGLAWARHGVYELAFIRDISLITYACLPRNSLLNFLSLKVRLLGARAAFRIILQRLFIHHGILLLASQLVRLELTGRINLRPRAAAYGGGRGGVGGANPPEIPKF